MNSNNEESDATLVKVSFVLNGKQTEIKVKPWETALTVLREQLGLTGTKEGCGIGECGACTILVDGRAVDSCLLLAPQLDGRDVQTVEGLGSATAESEGVLHPLQEAFISHGAVQCGFCTPGVLMSAKALLDQNPSPGREEIIQTLSGNLCRCTGYIQILDAVEQAAKDLRETKPHKG
ncbi:MAG: (2Fe-2S)-binding protein [Desulfomonile tiedjei]|nr:(2Fe-2S)-binding protein [Desulfomonile tiedjei]